uniref:cadherin-like protein 26 n=1 Tax=Gasterosteus aculeatus aculeatus TaxID=481459 RepID=UPI0000E3F707|nr:cadherin-like protein 26 [Gasterosteus aculeatus aculeatus]
MSTIHLCLFLVLCLGANFLQSSSSGILKRQKRRWIINSYSIDEGYKGPFPYVLDQIKIEKTLIYFEISGPGVEAEPRDVLRIDRNTGVITVHRPVDYEIDKSLMVKFRAFDRESHVIDTELGVEILIIDANDNPPKFDRDRYEVSTKEATSQGSELMLLTVTDKDITEKYQLFDFKIVSVHPQPSDLEFYITKRYQTGTISFKGCLDHEKAEKYTIIVEARGQGAGPQLSSSSTVVIHVEDGNNHLPVITGQTGLGRVREGEENVLIKSLQVTDSDTRGTEAWRAKFRIHGDANNHFRISTDPKTNEGLLFVNKAMDYEDGGVKNLTISVENEIPFASCKVVERSAIGLWKVTTGGAAPETLGTSGVQVTVIVEDVNEPPAFKPPQKVVAMAENAEAGKHLETFTAVDPDVASGNTIVYKKGDDPADWVEVDPQTGKITTTKALDRESTFVKDGVYTVTLYAVDNGRPPMTGTATLNIQILDQNDNAPSLAVSAMDMCQSDGRSLANITGLDPDAPPYGGPFTFQLKGTETAGWKLDATQGYSVHLVKEPTVPSGEYELLLDVFDLQGVKASHNLSVTVCTCEDATATPNCRQRRAASSAVGVGALAVVFLCILLLAGLLLLSLLVTCEKKSFPLPYDPAEQVLMRSNTEKPGSDCTVAWPNWVQIPEKQASIPTNKNAGVWEGMHQSANSVDQHYAWNWGSGASSTMNSSQHRNTDSRWNNRTWGGGKRYSTNQNSVRINAVVLSGKLKQRLAALEHPGEELGDYAPCVYAEEGDDAGAGSQLDAISICDASSGPDLDLELDSKFNDLASVCMEMSPGLKLLPNNAL